MIYLPLLCGRPEVLQGDSTLEVLQGFALPCPGETHAVYTCFVDPWKI